MSLSSLPNGYDFTRRKTRLSFPIGIWLPFLAEIQGTEPLGLSFLYYVKKFTDRREYIVSWGPNQTKRSSTYLCHLNLL